MADDVRISTGLPSHPKTRKLERRVGRDGCWSLIVLFLWVGNERWDGRLDGLTDEDIELAGDWRGTPQAFVDALVEVGFLRGEPGARYVHSWQDHNPYAAGKGARIAKGKRAAEARWSRESKAKDAPSMPEDCYEHAASSAEQCPPAPAPTPSPPSDTTARTGGSEGQGTDAGRACRAMGMAGMNPSHPHLLAALDEGVSIQALADTATEARSKGKGFAWAISTARGRHAEGAARINGGTHEHPRRLSASEQARAAKRERDEARTGLRALGN